MICPSMPRRIIDYGVVVEAGAAAVVLVAAATMRVRVAVPSRPDWSGA